MRIAHVADSRGRVCVAWMSQNSAVIGATPSACWPVTMMPDMRCVVLYCAHCWTGYGSIGERPLRCPACDRVAQWMTQLPQDQPRKPYELTPRDKSLLHVLKIDPE